MSIDIYELLFKQSGQGQSEKSFFQTMYRAIIAPVLPTAPRAIFQLRYELVKQFINSPLCSRVLVHRDEAILDDSYTKLQNQKMTILESIEGNNASDCRSIVVFPHLPVILSTKDLSLDRIVTVESIFKKSNQGTAYVIKNAEHSANRQNASVFQVGYISPCDGPHPVDVPLTAVENLYDQLYPIACQFLPARFRNIQAHHLAQAIRLNYETCEFMAGSEGIEALNYVDCMKVIGLEERI